MAKANRQLREKLFNKIGLLLGLITPPAAEAEVKEKDKASHISIATPAGATIPTPPPPPHTRTPSVPLSSAAPTPTVPLSSALQSLLTEWYNTWQTAPGDVTGKLVERLLPLLDVEKQNSPALHDLWEMKDAFPTVSFWILGGDGWVSSLCFFPSQIPCFASHHLIVFPF